MRSDDIYKMAGIEYRFDRPRKGRILSVLAYILEKAEDVDCEKVWFTTEDIGHGSRNVGVIIQSIDALNGMYSKLGLDFVPEYQLLGMQSATQDYDGYCMSVLTTHDLNSAVIPNLSELVFRIRRLKEYGY